PKPVVVGGHCPRPTIARSSGRIAVTASAWMRGDGCSLEDLKRAPAQHERPSSLGGKLQTSVTPPRTPDREAAAARYGAPGIDRLIASSFWPDGPRSPASKPTCWTLMATFIETAPSRVIL